MSYNILIMPKLIECTYPGCRDLVSKGTRCDKHIRRHGWQDNRGTKQQRGYGKVWEMVRAVALKRDGHMCVQCAANGQYREAKEVDHIVPKSQGGSDDLDNLQSLCKKCHDKKTYRERV